MSTRIVLGENIWFVVDESLDEIMNRFDNDSTLIKANCIDGYEIAVIKDRIVCMVSVSNVEMKDFND